MSEEIETPTINIVKLKKIAEINFKCSVPIFNLTKIKRFYNMTYKYIFMIVNYYIAVLEK